MAGTLKVITNPQGASIEIDHADTGKNAPNEFILSAGNHHWAVFLNNYVRMEGDVTINDSEIQTLIIPLQAELSIQIVQLAKIGLIISGIIMLTSLFRSK